MSLPNHSNPSQDQAARAPYNFVPLPDKVLTLVSQEELRACADQNAIEKLLADRLPSHASNLPERYSGFFEVCIETLSPTYIRGPLNAQEYENNALGKYVDGETIKNTNEVEFRRLAKNKPEFFSVDDSGKLVIPGSSLRGMLRHIVELVSAGKATRINERPRIFFRSMADVSIDPLRNRYHEILGISSGVPKNLRVGFLRKHESGAWFISPAKLPHEIGGYKNDICFRVKENLLVSLREYIPLGSKQYRPQYIEVSIDPGREDYVTKDGKKSSRFAIKAIGSKHIYQHEAWLVCSGNMLETHDWERNATPTPVRLNQYIVLKQTSEFTQTDSPIPQQVIEDYLEGLTQFQKQLPFDEKYGALKEGWPIFYAVDKKGGVVAIGSSPNFRLPLMPLNGKRAASPKDFVPPQLRKPADIDYAEALFGFMRSVSERKEIESLLPQAGNLKQGNMLLSYAGRIFIGDARLIPRNSSAFDDNQPHPVIVPKILSSPKPSSFQLYMTQPKGNSGNRAELEHFGNDVSTTTIRGNKIYWHKGPVGIDMIRANANEYDTYSTQHTQIQPIGPGNVFKFTIWFENLSKDEVGLLWWVLRLPTTDDRQYAHSLGMGKPFGMGAIALYPRLYLVDHAKRYDQLFGSLTSFETGCNECTNDCIDSHFLQSFVQKMAAHLNISKEQMTTWRLEDDDRIRQLLSLMAWPGLQWDETSYMTITGQRNEYADRKVLPDSNAEYLNIRKIKRLPPPALSSTTFNPNPLPQGLPVKLKKSIDLKTIQEDDVYQAKVIAKRGKDWACDLGLPNEIQILLRGGEVASNSRFSIDDLIYVRINKIVKPGGKLSSIEISTKGIDYPKTG